jgi:hypothetical protein
MNTTTWTTSPAALLVLGGAAMRPCTDLDLRTVIGVSPAPRGAQVRGTGVPAGGTAVRLRPVVQAAFAHNSIDDTTLGFHPSRRPQS